MPVSKTYLKGCVNRLCSLPGQKGQSDLYDTPGEAKSAIRNELGRALEKHAASDEHADRIVEALMRGTFRPTPAEIAAIAGDCRRNESLPAGCDICQGEPWVTVEKIQWEFPKAKEEARGKQYIASGSRRCECDKGRWFRAKDAENKAKAAGGL